MAYASTYRILHQAGDTMTIEIRETEAAAASESDPFPVFKKGRILNRRQTIVSGSAATTNPELGRKAGWTDGDFNEVAAAPGAADVHNIGTDVEYFSKTGQMYLRSQVNAGADNVVLTELDIEAIR